MVEEKAKKKLAYSRQQAKHVTCENVGLYRSRRDVKSQPVGSCWIHQRTQASNLEKKSA
jgi:hypothetical protein